ncbi:hypothetical protein B0J17DRAFT_629809 [Rhizoctonia solani]|nr:hypothetical protein B0J17DRAFT_629809 [Rhizoctonia solani]
MHVSNRKIKLRLAAKRAREEYMRNIQSSSQNSPESALSNNQPTETLDNENINTIWPRQLLEEPLAATGSASGIVTTFQAVALQISSSISTDTVDMELKNSAVNRPPTIQEATNALEKVSDAIRTPQPGGGYTYHKLDHTTQDRFAAMKACLINYLCPDSKGFVVESLVAAWGQLDLGTHHNWRLTVLPAWVVEHPLIGG